MDPVTFYVENGVGKRIAEAINLFTDSHNCGAIVQHVVHPQMQLPQHGDEWWIADATKLGYVIITGDLGIFRTKTERETVERTKARIIGYARADYTGWQKLAGITSHWTPITEQLEKPGPWILKIYAGQTTPVLLLPEQTSGST
jgi:PIN like domain